MAKIPEPNQAAPIGQFVRDHLPAILAYCEDHPDEFENLLSESYRSAFRIPVPFLVKSSGPRPTGYWAPVHMVHGYRVRVTSEWFARSTAHFISYLVDKEIRPIGLTEDFIDWAIAEVDEFDPPTPAPGGPRHRSYRLGVSQNALVRYLLSNVGHEAFNESEWTAAQAALGNACMYCGATGTLHMDHAIPISRTHLGEHKMGNLVPACPSCNAEKGQQRYDGYLLGRYRHDPAQGRSRIEAIDNHTVLHGYEPITAGDHVRELIAEARTKIAEIADEYHSLIDGQLSNTRASR